MQALSPHAQIHRLASHLLLQFPEKLSLQVLPPTSQQKLSLQRITAFGGVPEQTKATMNSMDSHFAIDLFHQIPPSKEGNIFLSPLSISSALSLTYLGSQGKTAEEFQKVLFSNKASENTSERDTAGKAGNLDKAHHQFEMILVELSNPSDDYELSIVNRLYGEKTFQFRQEYTDNAKKFYQADVQSVDFANDAEGSRKMINSSVESHTKGKIKDLLPKDSLGGTILLLVNAIYFKGTWENPFDEKHTEQDKFWLNKDTSKPVQMMKQTNWYNFSSLEDVQAKILEIPYKGKELSMLLLVPNEVDGLEKLEKNLTSENLNKWVSPENMMERMVELHLPRFHMEEFYNLKDTLMRLGIKDAFSTKDANFSGMAEHQHLCVSKVLHKCLVDVTEKGTEAAAAASVDVGILSALPEIVHADHPFLFLIKHYKSNSILFLGRLSSP